MKILSYLALFLLSSQLHAQSFDKDWQTIYQLEEQGSYKTLLQNVDALHKKATKNKNEIEKAKAFLFQMKVENILKETSYQKKVERLQQEISSSKGVIQSVYRWYYVKTLLSAYDSKQSYWRRNQLVETTTTSLPKEIDLWSQNQFKEEIVKQARLLFQNESLLKNTKISTIKDLVEYDNIQNNLNQSVYEFFATTFFKDYAYTFRDVNFLSKEINDFSANFSAKRIAFPSKSDEVRQELGKFALEVIQKLEKHYVTTNQLQALDKIRLERFNTFYSNVTSDDEVFQNLGKNLQTNFYKNRWQAMYANKLVEEANKKDKKDNYKLALDRIAEVKQHKSENDQWEKVNSLEQSIKERKYALSLKKEVAENEPVKYRINYKNTDTLHLAYYDFSKHSVLNDSVYQWVLKNQQPIKKATHILPKDEPYFQTSTEILGENVPLGHYLLVSYTNEKDRALFNSQHISTFKTTNVLVFSKNISSEQSALYVVHPKTGKPYAKTPIRFGNERLITDQNGKAIVSNKNNTSNTLEVYLPNETYSSSLYLNSYGQYINTNKEERKAFVEMYTDRALYRPGQEVHFKGILYESNLQGNEVLSKKTFQVFLKDDNSDEVEKMTVTTNEWGAFSGKFVLPKSIATGEFSLVTEELDEYNDKKEETFWEELDFPYESFDYRVEEYKRPTFDVTVDEIKKQISFDEKVIIKGKASSLAGGAIANAKVDLKINASYYDRTTWQSKELVKISKEIYTNDRGEFDYTFSVPSDSLSNILSKELVSHNVRYEVVITDPAGEVREDEGNFYVSNYKKEVSVYGTSEIKTDTPLKLSIQSNEVNGDFSAVTGSVKIYQTLPQKQFFEARPWELPELQSIDEPTFRKLFPYQSYTSEDTKVAAEQLVYEGKYTTQKEKPFELNIKDWKTGSYRLEYEVKDELSGVPIHKTTSFSIKKAQEKLASNENFNIEVSKKSNEKQLVLETNSLYENVHVYVEYFDKDAEVRYQKLNVKKGTQVHTIPLATKNDNQEISFNWYFVYHQELYQGKGNYSIESKQKEEPIQWKAEWISWNDKLNPAQQYQWKLLLKNAKTNQAFQGEFLASMYDASLDRIVTDYWNSNASTIDNYIYVNFSTPRTYKEIERNRLYTPYNDYTNDLYWNQWNYYNYSFDNISSYRNANRAELNKDFSEIEIRDAKTGLFIANATVFDIKNGKISVSNENGFAKIKNKLIQVQSIGYKLKRVNLQNSFSVVYLEQDSEFDNSMNITTSNINSLNKIYRYYNEYVLGYLNSKKEEEKFINQFLNFDSAIEIDLKDIDIKKETIVNEISGFVKTEYGDPIEGATILIVGTNKGVETDEEGAFKIKAYIGDQLEVKILGFFPQTKFIKDKEPIHFELIEENYDTLDEIVVTQYRSTSKEISGNSVTVTTKTIEGRPNATVIETLQGQVPGLNVSTGTGQPNDSTYIAFTNTTSSTIYGMIKGDQNHETISLRKNLSETAFFYPHLVFNKKGEVEINFTAPEALTEWKFRGLAHDKKMNMTYVQMFSKTQKDVMIQPNMPRFVREGDQIVLKARVSNTTEQPLKATALLRLYNTITGEEISSQIIKSEALVPTAIQPFSASTVSWNVQVPQNIEGLQYRISVQSGNFTDGEESVLPVLSNRQLVTETLPIWQLANETKTYQLDNLVQNTSQTLQNHQFRVDVSNNATWLMMQTLPYLIEYPHQCSEQLFAQYFANVLASHILENKPEIAQLVKEWKENPTSKLEQNEELKQVMLQETPWMKDLISDEEKKAQFANYFDVNRLDAEAEKIEDILVERQLPSGAVPWFSGGNENAYITQHILITAAQLKNLGIHNPFLNNTDGFINKAHRYLDVQFENKFQNKQEASFTEVIDYAFVKGYYKKGFGISSAIQTKIDKRLEELKKNWVSLSLYEKAKLAIVAQRKGETQWAKQIINQMEESAVIDETYGMYWKENSNRNYYYFNAAEVQSLIIEAYKETNMPQDKIQRLYAWLLSQKIHTDWGTTKATTQALYAILLGQQDANVAKGKLQVVIGKEKFVPTKETKTTTEEAAGNYSYRFVGDAVKNEMGKVEVKNTTAQPVFGGMYWQYFEDLSAIQSSQEGLLNIKRTYLKETKDQKWEEITTSTPLALGEKVKVRIQIQAAKPMSFVHVKDVRPATFEPLDVLSGYHYKNGLGYYQSTKDAATHFFIDYLPVGTYVVEYEVRLNNEGTFSSGISTIQSMYAPEHTGHTSGTKVEVK